LAPLEKSSMFQFNKRMSRKDYEQAMFKHVMDKHKPEKLPVAEEDRAKPIVNTDRVGRNQECPCNSGKKYKLCCLLTAPFSSA